MRQPASTASVQATGAAVRQGASTYHVYLIDVTDPMKPVLTHGFIQSDKFGPAWKSARALASTGKAHAEFPKVTSFFEDLEGTKPLKIGFGDHIVVGNVRDLVARQTKLTPERLKAALEDPNSTPEQQLATIRQMIA